jgi:hypothetical protein
MSSTWFKQTVNPELQQNLQHAQSVVTHPNVVLACSLITGQTHLFVLNRIQTGVACFHSVLKHEAFQALCYAVECLGPPVPQKPTTYPKDSTKFQITSFTVELTLQPYNELCYWDRRKLHSNEPSEPRIPQRICMEHMRNQL